VIQLTTQPIVLVANPSLPATTMADVIELARSKPGVLAYSTPGIGTPTHIAAELVAQRAGISWLHVPYAGSGPILKDVLSGEVPLSFTLLGGAEPYLRAGQLKAIAVTSDQRVTALLAVPTIAEAGLPGYEITSWHGVVAPAGTPPLVIERLQRARWQRSSPSPTWWRVCDRSGWKRPVERPVRSRRASNPRCRAGGP